MLVVSKYIFLINFNQFEKLNVIHKKKNNDNFKLTGFFSGKKDLF